MQETIFHYTSLVAFYNIIKEGYLRMFDVNKSNDPKEGKFVLDTFNKLLNDINWQKR